MSREHPLAPHRVLPVVVIGLLAVVALLAVKGPGWYQRMYHPLRFEGTIAEASRARGLDPYLVAALINVESGFDADDVSARGAVGLMQLLPSTAQEVARAHGMGETFDEAALKDPVSNVTVGTLHLADLLRRYATPEEALAAYNAGSGSADRWKRNAKATGRSFVDSVEYPETRKYIADVVEQRETYARLYPDAFEEPGK